MVRPVRLNTSKSRSDSNWWAYKRMDSLASLPLANMASLVGGALTLAGFTYLDAKYGVKRQSSALLSKVFLNYCPGDLEFIAKLERVKRQMDRKLKDDRVSIWYIFEETVMQKMKNGKDLQPCFVCEGHVWSWREVYFGMGAPSKCTSLEGGAESLQLASRLKALGLKRKGVYTPC